MALASQRQAILEAARVHGATDVRVFGSVARGTDGPASDIDLLVRMEPGRTIFDVGAFADAVEQLVGCPVDVVTEGALTGEAAGLLSQAVPL